MAAKVSLEDVARQAGVHRSTVSLALKDHPRISKPVRERIQAIAKRLGYRINPLVAALMQSRRLGRETKDLVLAYVTCHPTRFGWRPPFHDRPDYFPGAAERAAEFGCKLEHFWLAEPGMTPGRMSDILSVRGINGVMIGRMPPGTREISLAWERFSCVALGMSLRSPTHHRVAEDFFAGACRAADEIFRRGYDRLGFVFSDEDDSPLVGDQWLGACLRAQLRHSPRRFIPPFLFEKHANHLAAFAAWMKKHRPDALMVTHAEPVLHWLDSIGLRVPDDIGIASLINDFPERACSGIHCSAHKLGALATETLLGLMQRRETGIPADPHEVLLTGDWIEGGTLRP